MLDHFVLKDSLRITSTLLGIFLIIAGLIYWMVISAASPDIPQMDLMIYNWKTFLLIVAVMFCGTKLVRHKMI